jgi:hypothetical protein
MLDLETTGVDVSRCRIVEIAATQAVGRLGLPGACFAQVVKVPDEILRTPAAEAASTVHGIDSAEIAESHTFPMVWARFLDFVERCLNDYVHQEDGESDSDEETAPPRMPDEPPILLVAAHNGYGAKGAAAAHHFRRAHSSPR